MLGRLNTVAAPLVLLACAAAGPYLEADQPPLEYVSLNQDGGYSAAVVVPDVPLIHTAQIFPTPPAVGETDSDKAQVLRLFTQLDRALKLAGSDLNRTVKLNFYVTRSDLVSLIYSALAERFSKDHKPAISFVTTKLPHPTARLAADAVAITTEPAHNQVTHTKSADSETPYQFGHLATLTPAGSRIYVSGQAEPSESLAEATRKTLASLRATLMHYGRRERDILQLKAFLSPMSEFQVVHSEIRQFFGTQPVPPLVAVEWTSSPRVPIEIELIAWGGANRTGDVVEYSTPPGMTASPIYSRVAVLNHAPTIYLSGLFAATPAANEPAAATPAGGEREVNDIFGQLQTHLTATGSDLRHLVKATYYVATDSASSKLNELRPKYYDPQRPPAASKAAVSSVGHESLGLTIDMIATPSANNPQGGKLGPPEFGLGLSATDAADGWLSLFDGQSTLGWQHATVAKGALQGGATTIAWGPCAVRAQFAQGGIISVGGQERQVAAGPFTLSDSDSTVCAPIQLGPGVRLTQLAIRPLALTSLAPQQGLTGWRVMAHPKLPADQDAIWTGQNGIIRAVGGPSCLQYEAKRFADFILQVSVRTGRRHANGGVFVRARPDDFLNGYELQIFHRAEFDDPTRPARWSTGAIDDRVNARRVVSRDSELCCLTVVAQGRQLSTWVNGFQQVDWRDDRPLHDNPRVGCRLEAGTLQLQAHDRDSELEFHRIHIADWPPAN